MNLPQRAGQFGDLVFARATESLPGTGDLIA
jgi:hypothetical protein